MKLREKIIEEEQERARMRKLFESQPIPEQEPLEMVAARVKEERERREDPVEQPCFNADGERQMSWADRIRGLEGAVSDLEHLWIEDSERLKRIERMLVAIYKKLDL